MTGGSVNIHFTTIPEYKPPEVGGVLYWKNKLRKIYVQHLVAKLMLFFLFIHF